MERIADMNRERKMSVKANKSPTGKRRDVDLGLVPKNVEGRLTYV